MSSRRNLVRLAHGNSSRPERQEGNMHGLEHRAGDSSCATTALVAGTHTTLLLNKVGTGVWCSFNPFCCSAM